ncbi:GrpB family protein [Ktedonospora formicarum]|nr:GrpB family protein [Ktedonospora formicarum]
MLNIISYNTAWPQEFATIAQQLRAALGNLALRIDHIGSTSVPGLAAKDIIDVQVTVQDFTHTAQLIDILSSLGYTWIERITGDHVPPNYQGAETDWQKIVFRHPTTQRPTNLHVRAQGRPNQRYPILFRDYLRAHPVASAAYAQIKQALSQRHPDDVDFYYDIKDPLCDIVIEAAYDWAHTTNWQPGPSDG